MIIENLRRILFHFRQRILATKASDVRLAFRVYNDPDDRKGWWYFIVRSIALTQEVFLHNQIGQRYISVPKGICGLIFLYLCRLWSDLNAGIPPELSLDPFHPGFLQGVLQVITSLFRGLAAAIWDWKVTLAHLSGAWESIMASSSHGIDSGEALPLLTQSYGLVFNLRLVEIFVYNRLNILRHPHSSGEPHFFWTPLYWLTGVLRLRIDIVKQFGEPLLCWFLGAWIRSHQDWEEFKFVATWLQLGSVFLALRVYLENRAKSKLFQDQIANQLNSEALQAQQKLLKGSDEREFSTVKSNV